MLDQDTKRRIDACRDVLVGKIPDPKSQVEQITIALIYKFMDDMDQQSIEIGGVATFFKDGYKQYSWSNMFSPTIGGHELVKLYGEAIEKMNQNPYIPQLFRDIFKNAYLPYRDPETLKLFLKEINVFRYSHSEKLGDAFEYLLSFMGTQGDAGQFRTPRHIIDFIAAVVNPLKHEIILDPACGTAGFLISAFKHIIQSNDNGKQLTPAEHKRLLRNFSGYDISPDMVRLSLVNLYLHGFQDPKIFEYDTLTSEDRWNDSVDVILANPPFMTPKGGIRPHKRFSVQANRSEVLFVDYIAEHLNPGGRAGVIVPEGIIFQSSNAYKNLRKMLVENYLWAVVSLPAGVFQPYSGVKTSILFMDKTKAKQNDSILFVKIENDGFGLGAQRRPIDKDDLPNAAEILKTGDDDNSGIAHWIEKSKIVDSGDWNLSGERYLIEVNICKDLYPLTSLNEIADPNHPYAIGDGDHGQIKSTFYQNSGIPYLRVGDMDWNGNISLKNAVYISEEVHNRNKKSHLFPGDILISKTGATIGKVAIIPDHIKKSNTTASVGKLTVNSAITNSKYVAYIMMSEPFQKIIWSVSQKSAQPGFNIKDLKKFLIPLPSLSDQDEIVVEIDGYQKIIDGARQVVENYKPTIKIDPDWEMVKLGEIVTKVSSGSTPLGGKQNYLDSGVMFIRSQNVLSGFTDFSNVAYVSDYIHESMDRSKVLVGDVLLNITGASIGRCAMYDLDIDANVNQHVAIIRVEQNKILPKYLTTLINSSIIQKYIMRVQAGGSREALNYSQIKQFDIPLPSLSLQQEIVAQIEAEQEMVNANKKLIEIYEKKIKDKIAEVWGE